MSQMRALWNNLVWTFSCDTTWKNVWFYLTWHWLELARQFLWLDLTKSWLDSKKFLVTRTPQTWLGHITIIMGEWFWTVMEWLCNNFTRLCNYFLCWLSELWVNSVFQFYNILWLFSGLSLLCLSEMQNNFLAKTGIAYLLMHVSFQILLVDIPFLKLLMQSLGQKSTKLLIAIVSPLCYHILKFRLNNTPGTWSQLQLLSS